MAGSFKIGEGSEKKLKPQNVQNTGSIMRGGRRGNYAKMLNKTRLKIIETYF